MVKKWTALVRFGLSVLGVVVGTALLGTMSRPTPEQTVGQATAPSALTGPRLGEAESESLYAAVDRSEATLSGAYSGEWDDHDRYHDDEYGGDDDDDDYDWDELWEREDDDWDDRWEHEEDHEREEALRLRPAFPAGSLPTLRSRGS